ncbi:Protein NifX [Rhodovastum atsumiense]|uniref:Vanadium nitrogenase n=1 Tax=Rhodovastum atsumiense TaxID=504468 RepID=A0A5M6J0E8_9PROT|nr:NifB/NifX family molybdenum-iron cluster-binding protein [Rhodovastum atsumiense]KAA5614062.1 vanadium nitrogenase [Rhodovastum atsumiense]CAH2598878.1 Protein NifX [Rhodovastum atsumiense]
MLRIAFASTDRRHVDLHFGAAVRLVIYDVAPGYADLVGVGEFVPAEQVGTEGRTGLEGTVADKVAVKLAFLDGCAAVYAASIGASSIRRLMSAQIQPVIVDTGHDIEDLLNEVSLALVHGGLAWVDRAKARTRSPDRFDAMAEEGWQPNDDDPPLPRERRQLITSIDELA